MTLTLPPTRLLKCWGDEAVVYDTASGDTHYLKPMTFALYEACRNQPGLSPPQLANVLAVQFELDDTPQLHQLTEETLSGLRKIGLLESE